jgi:serine/threonine-protein kinase
VTVESSALERAAPAVTPSGVIKLAISPWGEIMIDGKLYGPSPPLREVHVSPGLHRVEVRIGASKPYVMTMRLAADEAATLHHRF